MRTARASIACVLVAMLAACGGSTTDNLTQAQRDCAGHALADLTVAMKMLSDANFNEKPAVAYLNTRPNKELLLAEWAHNGSDKIPGEITTWCKTHYGN